MKFWELLPFTESCVGFKSSVTEKKNLLTHKKGLFCSFSALVITQPERGR